jgi:hypothetical protein
MQAQVAGHEVDAERRFGGRGRRAARPGTWRRTALRQNSMPPDRDMPPRELVRPVG